MNEPIDISKLDKAEVLAALYNASRMQGISFLANTYKGATDAAWAQREIDARGDGQNLYFDYLNGRVMKINLGRDLLEVRLFDRDNGEGAAARALEPLFAALSQNATAQLPPPHNPVPKQEAPGG
ncbi:MAG: hypothetical protein NTV46_00960 [Verrucomicrobia bacterium]|nr:hypothetical protein [Verrucomicrobiota bacterium]